MENSVRIPDVSEIPKKARSLDLQSLYGEKSKGSIEKVESSGLKRKRQLTVNEEFGLGQGKKKKKSRKEVSLSSFESLNKKSKKNVNAVDGLGLSRVVLDKKDSGKKANDQVSGDGNLKNLSRLTDISTSLDANAVPIPKKPRALRRKKFQSNHGTIQARASENVSSGTQTIKLTDQSVTPVIPSGDKGKKVHHDSKEDISSRANSSRSTASVRYKDIISRRIQRKRGKRQESKQSEHKHVERVKPSVDNSAKPHENLEEDDEENLEENAARMLSSRFDPSCTVFSGNGTSSASQPANGLSLGPSIHGDSVRSGSNYLTGFGSNSADAAGRVLRPRRTGKEKRNARKRRHFYEIFSRDVDACWVINRRIKVFWPLDKSWYFGLVTSYDAQRKLHHVKYDDRDEEWINLQNERFKLLLLPSEVPRKPDSDRLGRMDKSVVGEKEDPDVDDDNDVGSFMDSEPIIAWLARATRRVKSSPLGMVKKQKINSLSKNVATAMLSEDSVGTSQGCLVDGSFRTDARKLSSDSVVLDRSDDGQISELSTTRNAVCSEDRKTHFVYFRKRFRQRGEGLGRGECRSIAVYHPVSSSVGRVGDPKEHDMAHQCFGVEDLDPDCILWSGENLGLLKLTSSLMKTKQVKLKLNIPLQWVNHTFGDENLWVCHTLLLLQYGTVMVVWPKVQLEMLFVDNVVGLRFLLFEGCLMQAVAFVCLVLVAFHHPNEYGELLDHQLPVTSIRFEISCFQSFGRRFVFVFYNFLEVKNSKWLSLYNKLKQYCSVTKQLPLSECTYDNIKILQSRSSLLPSPVCGQPASVEALRKKSRQGIMHRGISKESANVNMDLSLSNFNEKLKRVPQFLLPFAAAPTFFLGLHLKLLMAKNVASITFRNPLFLLEGPDKCVRSMADDCLLVEDYSENRIVDNDTGSSLSQAAAAGSEILSCTESKVDVDVLSISPEDDWTNSSQNCLNSEFNVAETSVGPQGPGRDGKNGIIELQRHLFQHSGSEQCAASSWPSTPEARTCQDNPDAEGLSRLNGMKVQIPTVDQVESEAFEEGTQSAPHSSSDLIWSVNDCAIRSPNPTAPRSIWHRNRHNSGSLSFGYRSKMWPDGRADLSRNGHVNGSRKPRSQVSYLLPFGGYDFSSKPRSHHRKGRPYKRIKTGSEKMVSSGSGSPQRRLELLSCDANVLITVGDRGWRECGAHVVLECVDHIEWKLLVKLSGVTKYSYKAYQFLQPGTTNRYTHAMMWKGGKDWILEFPDRSQWTLFKEIHEECYNRNIRAASVKTIPIPGVRLIEENDDNGVEVPFIRSSPKYFLQVETDVDMALNPSRVLYDMDCDDEEWISKYRTSSDPSVSNLMEISEEMFEKTMDMFEKVAYTQQREDFTGDEIEEFMVGAGPIDMVKDIYEYWKQRRRRKGMPLIRQLQPPLWEWYQQQLKEWETAINNKIHNLTNGCKEKATVMEKPPMFAFCMRPRGLEVPNKGSKQRSQRKLSAGCHNYSFSRDPDGLPVFGRKSNGFVCGEERFSNGPNHEYTSSWQTSARVISPQDASSSGYLSMSSDGSDRSQHRKLHRNKSKKIETFISHNDSQIITKPYNQRLAGKRNGVSRWNGGLPEWSSQNQHQREGFQKHRVEKWGGPDLDEFRLRDASSAAQHASNMAKLKREKAQRLLYRADLAIHKATVALMTAEAIKASSEDSIDDG